MIDLGFFKNKKVFITGHTGFKGSWICRILIKAGADVTGYSLEPPTQPCLFSLAQIEGDINSIIGDIKNFNELKKAFDQCQPQIVIHMAAQPIVRDSYQQPRYTYETNVMGTVNLLECVRLSHSVKSFLNVTTDKVYLNNEWCWGYRENEPLDGFDPYSNSKSCSELVTHSYNNSFLKDFGIAVSTARAGNVIGGGDFANDRIVPDCIRAQQENSLIGVRNPYSVRPYQHVLEAVMAYLLIAEKQFYSSEYSGWYNIGPDENDCVTTKHLVELFCQIWGDSARWENRSKADSPHESNFLKLDCSKAKAQLNWKPRWNIEQAVEYTCRWSKVWLSGGNIAEEMDLEIDEYLNFCGLI